jgi:hypothetical protein
MSPLSPDGKVPAMAKPPVRADIHEPLDVHRDLLTKISFHSPNPVDDLADAAYFLLGQVLHLDVG